jgi:hypothetical protein
MRLAVFVLGLGLVFALAVGVGSLVEPADTESETSHAESTAHEDGAEGAAGVGDAAHAETAPSAAPPGLAVSDDGVSLRWQPAHFGTGEVAVLRFSIVDSAGAAITEFDERHARRMHLIVVRRDGSGFQHLHPEMDAAGTWTTATRFQAPGVYRAFADFSVDGEPRTLATDLFVSGGDFRAAPFPPPTSTASTGGYEVELNGEGLRAGRDASLAFTVSRHGEPVEDLDPYLGARGHLVALREGDLAFLHVHPEEAGAGIAFGASFPSAGRYRLYLQFRHEGAVHTAEFTVEVEP